MKQIKLTQGQVAIVDDWWFDELNRYKWQAFWNVYTNSFYARRQDFFNKQNKIHMHAVIARTPKGMVTDHINHDTLDNREENLRVCTASQNMMNSDKRIGNTSGYKGVFKNGSGWMARIRAGGEMQYLGTYRAPEEAARAYDVAAKRLHGEFAVFNFSDKK